MMKADPIRPDEMAEGKQDKLPKKDRNVSNSSAAPKRWSARVAALLTRPSVLRTWNPWFSTVEKDVKMATLGKIHMAMMQMVTVRLVMMAA